MLNFFQNDWCSKSRVISALKSVIISWCPQDQIIHLEIWDEKKIRLLSVPTDKWLSFNVMGIQTKWHPKMSTLDRNRPIDQPKVTCKTCKSHICRRNFGFFFFREINKFLVLSMSLVMGKFVLLYIKSNGLNFDI